MTRSLTVLLNEADLETVAMRRPAALQDAVVAFDLDVHLAMRRRQMDHVTPFDVIEPAEISALRAFDGAIQAHWTTHARAVYRGVDLLALARYRHVSSLRRLAWAVHATERLLDAFEPGVVHTFAEPVGHGLHQPPGSNQMPLLYAALRGGAERRGVRVELIEHPDRWIDHASRATAGDCADVEPPTTAHDWVLCYGDGPDLLRQQPLVTALRAAGLTAVQVYSAASADDLARAGAAGPAPLHVSRFDRGPLDPPCVADLAHAARDAFETARSNAPAELDAWLGNRRLDIHLDFIFGAYLEAMARQVDRWQATFTAHPPGLVISASPIPMVDLAAQRHVPVLHVSHGLLTLGEPEYYALLQGGTIGAIGPEHARRLESAGVDAARIRVTGDPHVDAILSSIERRRADGRTDADARRSLDVPTEPPIVLLLSGTMAFPGATNVLPFCDFARATRTAVELGAAIGSRPGWTFVSKCHPRWDHPAMIDLVNANCDAGPGIHVRNDADLYDLLDVADTVVVINGITSALVEASLWKQPVFFLDTSLQWWDHDAWGTSCWPIVRSVADLDARLAAVLENPAARTAAVASTAAAVEAYLGERPGAAIERCVRQATAACGNAILASVP
jgi:hypothetical protein